MISKRIPREAMPTPRRPLLRLRKVLLLLGLGLGAWLGLRQGLESYQQGVEAAEFAERRAIVISEGSR